MGLVYDLAFTTIGLAVPPAYDKLMEMDKEIVAREKEIARLQTDGEKATMRMLKYKEAEILFSEKSQEQKEKETWEIKKHIAATQKKLDLGKDEIDLITAKARAIVLRKKEDLSGDEENLLYKYEAQVAEIEDRNTETVKPNIAGISSKKKAQEEAARVAIQIEIDARRQEEERIKAEGKEFDDNMKKKEEAFKNLAEFDERRRISSLDGEDQKQAQLLANYEKQKAEIEAMHEAQLLYAEDDMALKEEQYGRLLDMETTYQAEKDAISKEFAEMEEQRKSQAAESAKTIADEQKRMAEERRDLELQASAASLQNIATLTEGSKQYAGLYKASAIGEALINATQSVLKTMAGTPFPFNIPLAATQAAVAAVQVGKIASTKMYRGGMIPGMNTLIMANEQGREAILNPMAVRAIGGEMGVNALNRGASNSYSYDNSRSSNIVINTSIMTQKAFRDEIEPVLRRAERRR